MLLPGAYTIVFIFMVIVCLTICLSIGRMFGIAMEIWAQELLRKTKTGKKLAAGYNIKEPWWMKSSLWYYISWATFTLIFTYVMAGPALMVVNLIK